MNYQTAKKQFETTRKRKLANNTYLIEIDGGYAITLHSNQIISFYPDKTVLSGCGWRTVTTKARLNEFTEFNIWQDKGIWYITTKPYPVVKYEVFADGITYKDGEWTNTGQAPAKTQQLRKQVKQYAKDFVKALFAGEVPKPSGGDCWYCCMVVQDGKTLGEHTSSDHIRGHISDKERYYVPSLCVNACKAFGVSQTAYQALNDLWNGDGKVKMLENVAKQQIESAIRRYCYRQLGTA